MKSRILSLLLSSACIVSVPVFAQGTQQPSAQATAKAGKLVPVTEKDATWAANARKAYPLDVCVASGEKLGSMGKSPEYIYRVDGQPDRLVVFCCGGCEEDFLKDPAKHFAKIDAASKTKGAVSSTDKAENKGKH